MVYKFSPRVKKKPYQVRFWSTSKEKYLFFKKKCDDKGLVVQDVFNQFMEQFDG